MEEIWENLVRGRALVEVPTLDLVDEEGAKSLLLHVEIYIGIRRLDIARIAVKIQLADFRPTRSGGRWIFWHKYKLGFNSEERSTWGSVR